MEKIEDHCCYIMDYHAKEKNNLIDYEPECRSYRFYLHNDSDGTRQSMDYCPWCGAKLPKDLGDEWVKILKEEYNLHNPFKEWDLIPPEFKTDEWWKKRGL